VNAVKSNCYLDPDDEWNKQRWKIKTETLWQTRRLNFSYSSTSLSSVEILQLHQSTKSLKIPKG